MKKRIFLLGDSIRFGAHNSVGYGRIVENKLKDVAVIYQPDENCRFTVYTLRQLHEWAQPIHEDVDIVYWNNGLWDVLRINQDDPLIDISVYGKYLERITFRLKQLFPNARIIFALTTPVIEQWQDVNFFRRNDDIKAYNETAKKILQPIGVEIDDLYEIADGFHEKYRADWVHFDDIGCEILADHVIKSLGY